MTDAEKWNLFMEIHSGNPQEGPGDFESTAKAFSMLNPLPSNPRILDAGCGPGRQTLDLCRLSDGSITAVDLHQPYLDTVQQIAPAGRVKTLAADMGDLPLEPGSFDLIWSEGSIYNIGFFKGLKKWRPLLSENGAIAVTELSWLQPNPPDEPTNFWKKGYPQMQTVEQNLTDLERAGYEPLGHFTLPESAWWNYYHPLAEHIAKLEEKYADKPDAQELFTAERAEQALYRDFSNSYGYVFYIGRKTRRVI
ncbi:MAG: class I SAM-dependent methyltransferase [Kiritimatiellaceae bacterium]|nr:class I SAM-dependent methyltransferase [Kiritimatiellaceae bacterium]